ncbi:DUF2971 domain-containing protein [Arcobacter cloacae]|uniref:DUF2971 domain-containing protein n=1 Tax=Arcobacter cloacae TaxID=1054034 RepID=A0A4Q0ZIL7_9BACT|nr:DUF2971 domain-containing protein [Arcobacter cloacae]RXJ83378.1 hypothetical protein CRU90_09980 [Arcobacter cloacae]
MGNIMYHYCNVEAFKAIIQNKTLWLSSIYNLNDYKEIHWIKEKVLKKIQEITTKNNYEKFNTFIKFYENKQPNVYIASFSQGEDLLSQWRAYANDGYGVAIGFNTDYFKENNLIKTSKVLYNESLQEKEIEKILKPLFQMKDRFDFDSYEFEKFSEKIIDDINYLSAKSKNELFMEEQEIRLIHNPIIVEDKSTKRFIFENNISPMMFRAVCGNLIPYFELKFDNFENDNEPILEIIKGPKNKFIDQEIRIFLANNGFYNVKIKGSKSSYR